MTNKKREIDPAMIPMQEMSIAGCRDCLCRTCLYWWSGRCPHGECYDDLRAERNPYDAAHPGEPPRTTWSNWRGDQAHWCRGGTCYPQHLCSDYVEYQGSTVRSCLLNNVQLFQDGYIGCGLVETIGCEECYRRFAEKEEGKNE